MTGRPRGSRGDTLLEVVLSVLFIALVITTLVGALGSAVSLSDNHRDVSTGDVRLKVAAEAVKGAAYVAGTSAVTSYNTAISSVTGTTGDVPRVTTVRCIPDSAPAAYNVAGAGDCSTDSGLQLVTITVSSAADGVSESTTIVKRQT